VCVIVTLGGAATVQVRDAVPALPAASRAVTVSTLVPSCSATALADQLGDGSAAALVLRDASGAGLGDAFSASLRLLPRPSRPAASSGLPPVPAPGSAAMAAARTQAPEATGRGTSAGAVAGAVLDGARRALTQLGRRSSSASLQAAAAVRHGLRLGLTAGSFLLPDQRLRAAANLAGSAWDAASSTVEAAAAWAGRGATVVSGFGLVAARLSLAGSVLSAAIFLHGAAGASSRRRRLADLAMALGSGLQVAGWSTAGVSLLTLGAASATIPPLGLTLLAAGTLLYFGGVAYGRLPLLRRTGAAAVRAGRAALAAAAGAVRAAAGAVRRAARAPIERARRLAGRLRAALPDLTPW
jgi:hypothetical protein